jgi:two-component system phosphate regulon sensor histidine kinase PhoR
MVRFRKKILVCDLLLFLVFSAFLFFFLETRFFLPSVLLLLIYGLMGWGITHRFTRPIQKIIDVTIPYREGDYLPQIQLDLRTQGDEFNKLADTLNSLTERIRKQIENLQQQRKETEVILDSLGEGVIGLDTSAQVTYVNQVASRMLGVSCDVLTGVALDQIQGRDGELCKRCHELVLQALQTSEPIMQAWTLLEGGRIYLDLIAAPLAHQNGAILVLQDKTSDYKILEMGKDFIANASHELRTPITIIRGFAETMQDLPELNQTLLREITEKIVRTCIRLDKLVKSLLTLSNMENLSAEDFSNIDLVAVVENCICLLKTAYPAIQISLKSEFSRIPVIGGVDLLDMALMNLLENAVKYSQGAAKIEISLWMMGTQVHLRVVDQGIGIPDADLPHIFDRFYTVDKARSRKSGGAGLGLSIVKTIVEKHNGTVGVSSELGVGSVFTVALPLKNG